MSILDDSNNNNNTSEEDTLSSRFENNPLFTTPRPYNMEHIGRSSSQNAGAKEAMRRANVLEGNDISLWDAVWSQMNFFADDTQARDKNGNVLHRMRFEDDPEYTIDFKQAKLDGLDFVTLSKSAEAGRLNSQEAYDNLRDRVKWDRRTQEVMGAHSGLVTFAYSIPAFVTNPINWPEMGIAAWTGGTSLLTRLGVGAVASGTTGYVDEEYRQSLTGLPDAALQANVTAFSAILGAGANGVFGKRLNELNSRGLPNLEEGTIVPPGHALNASNVDKVWKDGKLVEFDGVIPEGSSYSYSLLGSMYSSTSNTARNLHLDYKLVVLVVQE